MKKGWRRTKLPTVTPAQVCHVHSNYSVGMRICITFLLDYIYCSGFQFSQIQIKRRANHRVTFFIEVRDHDLFLPCWYHIRATNKYEIHQVVSAAPVYVGLEARFISPQYDKGVLTLQGL